MAFTKKTWVDKGQTGATPLNATNLNNLEDRISNATAPINDLMDYTKEQQIGIWKDGKPIYRKIITYTQTSAIGILNDITHILIPHNIANFKQVIKIDSVSSIGNVLPILNGTNTSSQSASISSVDSNNINFRLINIKLSVRTWYFTLEYTKTI